MRRRIARRDLVLGAAMLLVAVVASPRVEAELGRHPVLSRVRAQRLARPSGWPRPHVLEKALSAWECAERTGLLDSGTLTIIDYSLPSTDRRLWVVDLERGQVLFHEWVAHGVNSGDNHAVSFSNRPGSRQSSLGLFRTDETYTGRHGLSLRLTGLEPGINDRARDRAIVIHGADYVSADFIAAHGRLGRSWGCPALGQDVHGKIIDRVKDGTAMFAYHPDHGGRPAAAFGACSELPHL